MPFEEANDFKRGGAEESNLGPPQSIWKAKPVPQELVERQDYKPEWQPEHHG